MKKYVSAFVIRSRSLALRAKFKAVLWDSQQRGIYVRKRHGKI